MLPRTSRPRGRLLRDAHEVLIPPSSHDLQFIAASGERVIQAVWERQKAEGTGGQRKTNVTSGKGQKSEKPKTQPSGLPRLTSAFCLLPSAFFRRAGNLHAFRSPVGKALILVVEDDPDVRRLYPISLNQRGFEVKLAANGAEAG